jgi:hypothetical protein
MVRNPNSTAGAFRNRIIAFNDVADRSRRGKEMEIGYIGPGGTAI